MSYEVQTNMNGTWENCWTEGNTAEDIKPWVFDTKEDAQAELDEFLADVFRAVEVGDMAEAYDLADYRIVEVK